jgi:diadenosine tetraphosphate (Ap4A) HIT family hydrolase
VGDELKREVPALVDSVVKWVALIEKRLGVPDAEKLDTLYDEALKRLPAPPPQQVLVENAVTRTPTSVAAALGAGYTVPAPEARHWPIMQGDFFKTLKERAQQAMRAVGKTSVFLDKAQDRYFIANKLAFAIWDLYPVSRGHALVVPFRVIPTWFDAEPDEQSAMWSLVHAAKAWIDDLHKPQGYNVGFNCGEVAGQTVPHAHIHVIPRYTGDTPNPRGGVRGVIPSKMDPKT